MLILGDTVCVMMLNAETYKEALLMVLKVFDLV